MQTLTLPGEGWRKFKSFVRSHRAATQSTTPDPERLKSSYPAKQKVLARLMSDEGEAAASHGATNHTRQRDGHGELRGGLSRDRVVGHEWRSAFQHEVAFASASVPLTVEQPMAPNGAHRRLLIADDDSLVRGSLAAVLASEGYVVDEARNGIEAVTRAIEYLPDLVLLDLNMPNWDGWTAFSQLDRVTPLLPIVVITARPNQYEKAVRLGVDAFMEKPLNIPVLIRAIKRLTSEDEKRHVRRITNPAFVTQLLGSADQ
jgi:CheY-like chemotaxis protein